MLKVWTDYSVHDWQHKEISWIHTEKHTHHNDNDNENNDDQIFLNSLFSDEINNDSSNIDSSLDVILIKIHKQHTENVIAKSQKFRTDNNKDENLTCFHFVIK